MIFPSIFSNASYKFQFNYQKFEYDLFRELPSNELRSEHDYKLKSVQARAEEAGQEFTLNNVTSCGAVNRFMVVLKLKAIYT